MREQLDALVTELRRLKRDGVSRVSVDAVSIDALRRAVAAGVGAASSAPVVAEAPPAEAVARPAPRPVSAPAAPAPEPVRAERPAPQVVVSPPASARVAVAPVVAALPPPPEVRLPAGDAATKLAALAAQLAADRVTKTGLAPGRTALSGDGAAESSVLFLIHMPGADDGFAGKLLTGAEGELYGKIVSAMGLSRERVHTAAVVPYRPEVEGGAHREPRRDEYAYYLPYLRARIAAVNPRVIVALGGGALEAMCGPGEPISKTRGVWREFDGIPVLPTFHISYLIRNNTAKSKRIVWEDLLLVMERLALPISAKQRGYFAEKA